jgi:hypothetical protein
MNTSVTITGMCRRCEINYAVTVQHDDYLKYYEGGALIQDAFPYLSVDDRELLISDLCGGCWASIFPKEGDDE